MRNNIRLILGACLIALLVIGIGRAARIQQLTGMGDMRGRVVGARLVKDGKLPYYYNWYPGDPFRYAHNAIIDSPRAPGKQVSSLTASPAVLEAMAPISGLQQYQVDWGAFVLFHLFFIASILLVLRSVPRNRWLTALLLMVPIVLTDGWLYHFMLVQYYMLFGFMLLIISLLLLRKKELLAGLVFAVLILFRFNTVLFLLPFLAAGFTYRRFILSTAAALVLYGIFVVASPFRQSLWQEYFLALKDNQEMHMDESFVSTASPDQKRIPLLTLLPRPFEGQDYQKLDSLSKLHPVSVYQESSSFKQAYRAVLHQYPPSWMLTAALLLSMGGVCLWLLRAYRRQKAAVPAYKYVLAGLLFYFLSGFFSTITTATYHFPQWWAVGAILAIYSHRVPKVSLVLFFLGIAMSFYVLPDFRGKHLLSEALLLLSCLWAVIAVPREEEIPGAVMTTA